MPLHTITVGDFSKLIETGIILPGDCVNVLNGERGFIDGIIARIQKKCLIDYSEDKKSDEHFALEDISYCAEFTHTAMIMNPLCIGELFYPKARCRTFIDLIGNTIIIKRPRILPNIDADVACSTVLNLIVDSFVEDVKNKVDYPTMELLYFYFRWYRKATWKHKFAQLFKNKKNDVCSARYVYAADHKAGIVCFRNKNEFNENKRANPEAWYPARMTITAKMKTIGHYKLISSIQ